MHAYFYSKIMKFYPKDDEFSLTFSDDNLYMDNHCVYVKNQTLSEIEGVLCAISYNAPLMCRLESFTGKENVDLVTDFFVEIEFLALKLRNSGWFCQK